MGSEKRNITAKQDNDYGRALKYLGIFGGAQGISMLLSMVRNKFASVLLGAAGLGFLSLYNRTIQLFSDFTGLSLGLSAVRRLSDAYCNEDSASVAHCVEVVRSIALMTGMAGMLLLLLLSPLVASLMFGDSSYYAIRLAMLSPVVLFIAVSNGELAILRGVSQPAKIAMYTLCTAVCSVLVTVPLYYILGLGGIFPAIFLVSFFQMSSALFFSTKLFRYKANPFHFRLLREGLDIVKLGAGYIYASILVSASVWVVCQVLSDIGSDTATGLFSAGYLLVGMLPSILFAAFDSDYYPRLAGIISNVSKRNKMVNEHIEVHLIIQLPVILGVIALLPWLLPLLFTYEFMPALSMVQIAVFALLFHVMTYPVSFMAVSKGDTITFAVQETVYNVLFVSLLLLGYIYYGWLGAGIGFAIARLADMLLVCSIAYFKYGFRLSRRAVRYFALALSLGLLLMALVSFAGNSAWGIASRFAVVAVSVALSLYALSRHGNIFKKIMKRFSRR